MTAELEQLSKTALPKDTFTETHADLENQVELLKSTLLRQEKAFRIGENKIKDCERIIVAIPRSTQVMIDKSMMDVLGDRKKYASKIKLKMKEMESTMQKNSATVRTEMSREMHKRLSQTELLVNEKGAEIESKMNE